MRNVPSSLVVAAALLAACFAITGCGGGGGSTGGTAFYGSIEGNVFVPGDRSGASLAVDRGDSVPVGYSPLSGATITATVGAEVRTGTTDAAGHFLISGVPQGRATLRVTPPAGKGFREYSSQVDVAAGKCAKIGSDGRISLLSALATRLTMTIDSVDASAWPTVVAHVSIMDPQADAALIGLCARDFTLVINGSAAAISSIATETSAGVDPHQTYVLTMTASGDDPGYARAEFSAAFCGRTGSGNGYSAMPTSFVQPMPGASLSVAYKAASYATAHPGKWHMGADMPGSINARVSAIAEGEVTAILISGEDGGVVVRHKVSADISTADGATRDIYVFYGGITPTVAGGATVEPGQALGHLRSHSEGPHLHLGVRIGQGITSAWDGTLVGGSIPAEDAFGLTDGYTDPVAFLTSKAPDNTPL